MKITFAIVGALLAVIGNTPYLIDIIKKRVQPHPYTWFVWSIVSGVTFFGQVAKGAGVAAIAFGASEIFTITIFFFSLRYGFKNIPKNDSYFLVAALLGIVPWIILKDPTWSVIIMVIIDLIAFIPTLRKTWRKPKTESPMLYGSNVLRHGFALLALSSYNIATMLHSISMIITNTFMTWFILRKKR
jgi:phosphoglycerol transferase MdoB-like AlkP superfamily enzyme